MEYPRYAPQSDHRPLNEAELEQLDDLLAGLPEAMNLEILDGFLTGLLLAPTPLERQAGGDWLPLIWGGDDPAGGPAPFASQKARKRLMMLVLRHVHDIDTRLSQAPERWEPIFSVAEVEDLDEADADGNDAAAPTELADAQDWCAGFLEACGLEPEAWGDRFDGGETAAWLAPIARLGGDLDASGLDTDEDGEAASVEAALEIDGLSRATAEGVIHLQGARQARSGQAG